MLITHSFSLFLSFLPFPSLSFSFLLFPSLPPHSHPPPLLGNGADLLPLHFLAASSCSKLIASAFTYPHEVVRTRVQTATRQSAGHVSLLQLVKDMMTQSGPRGFYKGFGTNLMRVVPAGAITFATYEMVFQQVKRLADADSHMITWYGRMDEDGDEGWR